MSDYLSALSIKSIGVGFVAGALVACGILLGLGEGAAEVAPLRQSDVNPSRDYQYIDPLLGLRNLNEDVSPDFAPLEAALREYIKKEERAGSAKAVSVKVRDLESSTGFTINPDERYAPASLLKVPTMMTYLKLAEQDRALLAQKIPYLTQEDDHMPMFSPEERMTLGARYSISELIERMIRYSDNEALILLERHLDAVGQPDAYETVARDLGVRDIHATGDFITIQGYGLFWRVLYNATYLTRSMSEEALRILTTTKYQGGIRAGVPSEVVVAHKFGESGLLDPKTGSVVKGELHDCGIVYYPSRPYLLCIMTKGLSMEKLDDIITEISRITYQDRAQLQDR